MHVAHTQVCRVVKYRGSAKAVRQCGLESMENKRSWTRCLSSESTVRLPPFVHEARESLDGSSMCAPYPGRTFEITLADVAAVILVAAAAAAESQFHDTLAVSAPLGALGAVDRDRCGLICDVRRCADRDRSRHR